MIIEVPDWCQIGKYIEVKHPQHTGSDSFYKEKILSYGIDGFFHQEHNCPVYFTRFSEYGKTVRECKN